MLILHGGKERKGGFSFPFSPSPLLPRKRFISKRVAVELPVGNNSGVIFDR